MPIVLLIGRHYVSTFGCGENTYWVLLLCVITLSLTVGLLLVGRHMFLYDRGIVDRGYFVAKGLRSFSVLTALEMSGECVRFFSVVLRMKIGKAFVWMHEGLLGFVRRP